MLQRLRHGFRRDERGIFLVWFALVLTLLLAMAGFAVDFWRWNTEGTREQKAADAAALAGAVYASYDPATAKDTAADVLKRNGYVNGQNDTTITYPAPSKANQLKVTIKRTVKNYFGGLVGVSKTTVTKSATAEYQKPINMGSPINQFGNDPQQSTITHGSTRYPDFWANVFGPDSPKPNGDAILSENCDTATDNCVSGTNVDNDPNGYFYGIDIGTSPTSPLTVQAFDPAFAHVGDNCDDSSANLSGAAALTPTSTYTFDSVAPSVRYAAGANSVYCTGDNFFSNTGNVNPWTTYIVRGPDDTANTPLDNPILCQLDFPGYKGDIKTALQNTSKLDAAAPGIFRDYFRRWYTLCTINNPTASSTYYVQIETKTKANGSAAPDGGGANRFALRAGLGSVSNSSTWTTTKAKIYGNGEMSIYANADAANTTFYLARVTPSAFPRVLVLNFFDVGDASAAGTLKVLASSDVTCSSCIVGSTTLNGTTYKVMGKSGNACSYTAPKGNSTGPPWANSFTDLTSCTIENVSSTNYQGQWITVKIPIPAYDSTHTTGYNCTTSNDLGCWTLINFAFPGGVADTTTWSANVAGAPLRIVE